MGRRLLVGALVAVTVLAVAQPADAHTVTGVRPTNYASRIVAIRPANSDLSIRLLDLGRRIEVKNFGRQDVVVLGYDGEPYLRVGPSGGFENRRSRSRYVNRVSVGGTKATVPDGVTATAAPSWRRVSSAPVVRWRDQRTRYEGAPPAKARQVVANWTIAMRAGDAPVAVSGIVTYIKGPSPWPWVGLLVVLAGLTVMAAWSSRWGRWLSVALALLLASDVMHSFGTAAATHESMAAQLVRVLLAGLVTTAAWVVGVVSIPSLQRNHEGGLVAAGGIGLVIAMFSGVTDVGVFSNSQVATVFPAVTARIAVAVAIGLGAGLVAATVVVIARDPRLRPTTGTPTQPLR
jgi:hypothetical protein